MDHSQGKSIKRDELYRLVWARPMIHVAAEFGISGNGLSKICRKLDVPYPPRGYWAKLNAGKAPAVMPLPKRKDDTPEGATITRALLGQSDASPEVVRARALFDEALEKAGEIFVPDRLSKPHPIIVGWKKEKERRQERARHERNPWTRDLYREPDFTSEDRRRHRILHALFNALEKGGGTVVVNDRNELSYEQCGESITFQLRGKLKQVKRPLTEREKRWKLPSDKEWRQELEPTGKLVFEFKSYLRTGFKREWLESDKRTLESMLPEIIATFWAAIPLLAEQTKERELAEQHRREAERLRQEEEARRHLDDARWRKFVELSEMARQADLAREFLASIRRAEPELNEPVGADSLGDWIGWAEEQLLKRDPLRQNITQVFFEIAKTDQWPYR